MNNILSEKMVIQENREERLRKIGSPAFNYINSATITSAVGWVVAFVDTDAEAKYLPFTYTRILNNTNYSIYFYKNQGERHEIKGNSSYTFLNERIESFKVLMKTGGETATAGQLSIQMRTLPIDEDTRVREQDSYIIKKLLRNLKII